MGLDLGRNTLELVDQIHVDPEEGFLEDPSREKLYASFQQMAKSVHARGEEVSSDEIQALENVAVALYTAIENYRREGLFSSFLETFQSAKHPRDLQVIKAWIEQYVGNFIEKELIARLLARLKDKKNDPEISKILGHYNNLNDLAWVVLDYYLGVLIRKGKGADWEEDRKTLVRLYNHLITPASYDIYHQGSVSIVERMLADLRNINL